ncbi:hypothetical protein KP509_26G005200 [Ceratopteris richardii]|uniref:Uncharacterized protein n=1 Tax=Ceratopteris richardii TaxID=49495 RepID=A0A8T2RKB0_CERRI|nr:hypothetical protein KP509_26G005200 [Ceratopteris richardii]
MCGGIREFEILRSAAFVRTVISQFQQEIKPSGYGYDAEADDTDFPCYISSMNSWIPTLIAEKDCNEKKCSTNWVALPRSLPQWIAQMEQLQLWWRPSLSLSVRSENLINSLETRDLHRIRLRLLDSMQRLPDCAITLESRPKRNLPEAITSFNPSFRL